MHFWPGTQFPPQPSSDGGGGRYSGRSPPPPPLEPWAWITSLLTGAGAAGASDSGAVTKSAVTAVSGRGRGGMLAGGGSGSCAAAPAATTAAARAATARPTNSFPHFCAGVRIRPGGACRPRTGSPPDRTPLHRLPDRTGLRNWRVVSGGTILPNGAGLSRQGRAGQGGTCGGTLGPARVVGPLKSSS